MSLFDQLEGWIADHKLVTFLIVIAILVPALFLTFLSSSGVHYASQNFEKSVESGNGLADYSAKPDEGTGGSAGSYVEVQEGDVNIKSENVDKDSNKVKDYVKQFNGYVEQSHKSYSDFYNKISLTIRLPSEGEKLNQFIEELKQEFKVESYNVKNYRISIQQEMDELTVLNKTIGDYEEIRQEVNQMENNREKMDLLMELTEKELDLKEKQDNYERDLSREEMRGDMATVNVMIKEKKSVKVIPQNIGNRFKNKVQDMLDSIVNILMNIVTFGVTLFFRVIQIIIYLIIIIVPLAFAYKLGKKAYRKYW